MTEIMLRGALSALKTKIEALASSNTATAEDLAMLGTALERIAGKTTAIEVQMVGEAEKTLIAAEALAQRTAALNAIADAVAAADAAVTAFALQIATEISDAQGVVQSSQTAALETIGTAKSGALVAVEASRHEGVEAVNAAASTAITTAAGLSATSFFFNQL